jgi:hypothetical protein
MARVVRDGDVLRIRELLSQRWLTVNATSGQLQLTATAADVDAAQQFRVFSPHVHRGQRLVEGVALQFNHIEDPDFFMLMSEADPPVFDLVWRRQAHAIPYWTAMSRNHQNCQAGSGRIALMYEEEYELANGDAFVHLEQPADTVVRANGSLPSGEVSKWELVWVSTPALCPATSTLTAATAACLCGAHKSFGSCFDADGMPTTNRGSSYCTGGSNVVYTSSGNDNNKTNTGLIVGIILLVLVLVAILAWMVWRRYRISRQVDAAGTTADDSAAATTTAAAAATTTATTAAAKKSTSTKTPVSDDDDDDDDDDDEEEEAEEAKEAKEAEEAEEAEEEDKETDDDDDDDDVDDTVPASSRKK